MAQSWLEKVTFGPAMQLVSGVIEKGKRRHRPRVLKGNMGILTDLYYVLNILPLWPMFPVLNTSRWTPACWVVNYLLEMLLP